MANLQSSFDGSIDGCNESTSILYHIGQLNPYKLTKLSFGRKVSLNMSYYATVKLGKLNIQRALGKNKFSLTSIGKAFVLKKLSYDKEQNKTLLECKFIINKSHKIYIKAYELADGFERIIANQLASNLNTTCSKISAPYHIDTCYTYYNLSTVKNQQLKDYLKKILKEVDNFEAK